MYQPRSYRHSVDPAGLVAFRVVVAQTDLQIVARSDLTAQADVAVRRLRAELESYVAAHPRFAESFVPVPVDGAAPAIARAMAVAAETCGVGPMAAVAGAFAEAVARELEPFSADVIVENGGDVFVMGGADRVVGLWAGAGVPSVGLRVPGSAQPVAIATSSATIGPSVSLGGADAATVIAATGALADAAASVVGNRAHGSADAQAAVEAVRGIEGVRGALVSVDGGLAAWGEVELVGLASGAL